MSTVATGFTQSSRMARWLSSTVFLCLALLAASAAVYWPGLTGGFLFDDYPNIVNNPAVHMTHLDLASIREAAGAYQGIVGRPLATSSFALDHVLNGLNPWGYKLSSLIVHLANAALVLALVLALLRLPRIAMRNAQVAAFTIALIWSVHPIQASTVLYIVQRMEMLSLTFVLLALLAYLRGRGQQMVGQRGWPWIVVTVPLGLLGLLAKETAVLLPLYALALELTVLKFEARSPRVSKAWKLLYGTGVAAALLGLIAVIPSHLDPALYAHRTFNVAERLLSQLRILPMYLGQILLPLPSLLQFYYDDFPVSHSLLNPVSTAVGGLLLVCVVTIAWRVRRAAPLFTLGVMWFFGAHVLTSSMIPLELAFEHRNYFATLGVLLAATEIVRRIGGEHRRPVVWIATASLAATLGTLAIIRTATWGNPLLLATQMVAANPLSARASVDLAARYGGLSGNDPDSPMYAMAVREFERGARLPNASPLSEQGVILLSALSGAVQQPQWWQSLREKLLQRPIGAQERSAVTSLMARRYEGVPIDDAELSRTYALFVERSGSPPGLCVQYGDYAHTYLRDDALAERMYVKAIETRPLNLELAATVVSTLVAQGRPHLAASVLKRLKELDVLVAQGPTANAP